jgi:protocatechuate 3,4-dioxygenase beta subunit
VSHDEEVSRAHSSLLLAADPANAKCDSEFFVFSGKVTDKAGVPLPGASVGISWSEWDGPSGPAFAITDSMGRFFVPVAFGTYSGKGTVVEDVCDYRVRSVSFSAHKGRLRSAYRRVAVGTSHNVALPTQCYLCGAG